MNRHHDDSLSVPSFDNADEIAALMSRFQPVPRPALTRQNRSLPAVASFAQERLWFLSELGEGWVYQVPVAFRVCGGLDVEALRLAVGVVVERHESLRTVFRVVDGVLRQVVLSAEGFAVPFECVGVDGLSVEGVVDGFARRSFDLSVGPLVRCLVVRVGPLEDVFVFVVHHIVFDEWSLGVFSEGWERH